MSESTQKIFLIGIDEAGRGPLAGPVVVGGIAHIYGKRPQILDRLKDSKKLSPKQREEWFLRLTSHPEIRWAVAKIWPKVIDRINIYQATLLGARRVCAKLSFFSPKLSLAQCHVLLDGSLYLPKNISHETIIKGDEKLPAVAAASIIAKVIRDRTMLRLHKKYPKYRFDLHKGYATKMHREFIEKLGSSKIHRFSFRVAKS